MTTDEEFEKATKASEETGMMVVTAVTYDPAGRVLTLRFANGMALTSPVDILQGLVGATDDDLAEIEIVARGLGLHWPKLDADLWVSGLLAGVTGTRAFMEGRSSGTKASLADWLEERGGLSAEFTKEARARRAPEEQADKTDPLVKDRGDDDGA